MEKESLKETVEVVNGGDDHLLLQSDDEQHALDVARRIHDQSQRASLPYIVFNAATLLIKDTGAEMLRAFTTNPLSPLDSAGRGTLVIRNIEQIPDEFQHILARIIDRGAPKPRPASSNLPYLEARVIMIESSEEKTHSDLRTVSAFIPLDSFEDDL